MSRRLFHTAILFMVAGSACLLPLVGLPAVASADTKAPIVVSVRSFGAVGNGVHDDAAAIQRAVDRVATRPGSTVVMPRGTYLCSLPIRLADHVNLRGVGQTRSWLKGRLEFGSFSSIGRLKIGRPGACALTNRSGAKRTSVSRCRLHGGGSRPGVDASVVYLGGPQGSVSNIVFAHCAIERTCYVPPAGVDAFAANVGNTITIHEFTYLPESSHIEDITFRHCRLGASNGHAKGALRMMMEAYCWAGDTKKVYHGWKDLTFDGCTIEASDTTGLDFADQPLTSDPTRHCASGVLINDCTFLGARKDATTPYTGLPIVYECPTGIVIKNSTFYATPHDVIGGSWVQDGTNAPGLLIRGNTFDMTRSPIGLEHERGEPCIGLVGFNSRVIDNTFIYDAGMGVLIKGSGGNSRAASGNVVRGNRFTDKRASGGEPTIWLIDLHSSGCFDNHIVGNTIRNRAAGRAGVITQTGCSGTNYAENNTLICGTAVPFVVRSGKLVQSGNVVQ